MSGESKDGGPEPGDMMDPLGDVSCSPVLDRLTLPWELKVELACPSGESRFGGSQLTST